MRTELVFFDTSHQGRLGTLRGAVALAVMLLWVPIHLQLYPETSSALRMLIALFLIISAIGVQLPQNGEQAAVYGALVGLVVFGCSLTLQGNSGTPMWKDALYVGSSSGVTALAAYVTYRVSSNWS